MVNDVKKLLSMLDCMIDMVIVHDLDGTIIYANDALCKTTGYTRDECSRLNVRQISPEDKDSEPERAFPGKEITCLERKGVRKDGTSFPVEVTARFAEILRDRTRGGDVAARYGGEEFVVVLSNIALQGSLAAAEKLRKAVAGHGFAAVEGRVITVSVGVAEFGGPEDTREGIKKRADDALYVAKREGKNRVQAQP